MGKRNETIPLNLPNAALVGEKRGNRDKWSQEIHALLTNTMRSVLCMIWK